MEIANNMLREFRCTIVEVYNAGNSRESYGTMAYVRSRKPSGLLELADIAVVFCIDSLATWQFISIIRSGHQ